MPLFAACTENTDSDGGDGSGGDARTVAVTSTDDECEVSAAEAPAGTLTFDVTNDGSQVTEFYLLGEDGLRIVAEVENIGPQLSRQLVVNAPAGTYVTACKPGMKGDGIRADFTVTESDDEPSVSADDQELVDTALANYRRTSRTSPTSCVAKTDGVRRAVQVRRRRRRPRASTRTPASTGSGSRPWPSRSATSTR